MHRVAVDRAAALVSMVVDGYFTEADLAAAAKDLHVAIRSLGPRAGEHVTLYDMTDLKVASAAVLTAFADYFRSPAIAPLWARKVALVTRSPLVLRQMERVAATRETVRVFDDRRAAVTWLLADQERVRSTSQPTRASG